MSATPNNVDAVDSLPDDSVLPLDSNDSIIFVSVPSYRDSECPITLSDMISKAKFPDRIIFGVCEQNEPGDTPAVPKQLLNHVGRGKQIRLTQMHASEAKGPVFARAMIESSCLEDPDGIEVFLQIDSHTRVVRNWDVECIDSIKECEQQRQVGTKPAAAAAASSFVISMAPNTYLTGVDAVAADTLIAQQQKQIGASAQNGRNANSSIIIQNGRNVSSSSAAIAAAPRMGEMPAATTKERTAKQIASFGTVHRDAPNFSAFHSWHPTFGLPLRYEYQFTARAPRQFYPTGFYSAGFALGRLQAWQDVPNDAGAPYLFIGEEQSMAARLYTHGYDIMLPKKMLLYSLAERRYRPVFWEQTNPAYKKTDATTCAQREQLHQQSLARVRSLLTTGTLGSSGVDSGDDVVFGLGTRRSLSQFENFVGLQHATQVASVRARLGMTSGASDAEWHDKHGAPESSWKQVYKRSLERNFLPLEGPPPPDIKTVSAKEFSEMQRKRVAQIKQSQQKNGGGYF